MALHVGWVLNTHEGFEFFKALLETENIEIYDNTYIKILIDYLYQKYKFYIAFTSATGIVGKLFFLWIG